MVETNGVIKGLVTVTDTHVLRGIAAGGVRVMPGGQLILHGIANRIDVEKHGVARVHGTVNEGLFNDGGDVEVYGTVNGGVHDLGDTITVIAPGASVR
jgi:hypothetical protein